MNARAVPPAPLPLLLRACARVDDTCPQQDGELVRMSTIRPRPARAQQLGQQQSECSQAQLCTGLHPPHWSRPQQPCRAPSAAASLAHRQSSTQTEAHGAVCSPRGAQQQPVRLRAPADVFMSTASGTNLQASQGTAFVRWSRARQFKGLSASLPPMASSNAPLLLLSCQEAVSFAAVSQADCSKTRLSLITRSSTTP